jgi:hypothetical protein
LRRKAIGAIVGIAVLGILLTVVLFGHQSGIATASLQNSASNDDTLVWRVAGWYQLLFNNPARNSLNDLVGQPFGTGFERIVGDEIVTVPPHDWYLAVFLRLGVLGLILMIAMYRRGMQRLKHVPSQMQSYVYPDSRFWALVLVLQFVYFCTYGADYEQSALAGIALAGLQLKPHRIATPENFSEGQNGNS